MFKKYLNGKIIAILPLFIAVNLAAIFIGITHLNRMGVPLILGMLAAGLVNLDNHLIGRLKDALVMLILFTTCTVIIQLNIDKPVAFTLIFTAMAFVLTIVGAIGPRYSTVAFGTLLVSVYTTLSYNPHKPWWITSALISSGALVYSVCSLFVYFIFPNRSLQENLANVFEALGGYFLQKAKLFNPDEWQTFCNQQLPLADKNSKVIQAFNACQDVLFYRTQGKKETPILHLTKYYFLAQEIFEQVSADYFDHLKFAVQNQHTDLIFRIQRVMYLFSKTLEDFAISLRHNTNYSYDESLNKAIHGLTNSIKYYEEHNTIKPNESLALHNLLNNVINMNYQLRNIKKLKDMPNWQNEKFVVNAVHISGLKNIGRTILKNFTLQSQLFRHAVRLAIVVFVSCFIIEILQIRGYNAPSSGYWILMTAVLICQPNYYSTKLRLKQRLIGSLVGVIVSSLLPYMHPTLALELGIIVITTTCFFFFRQNNYSYATFFITVQVLVSFYMMGSNITDTMLIRFLDTIVGGLIAFLATSYLWADWKYLSVINTITQSLRANSKYLLLIISKFQYGYVDPLQYRIARRYAQTMASKLANIVTMMNTDPKKYNYILGYANDLMQNNYALLNYIASIGVARGNIGDESFNYIFYRAFKQIIALINDLPTLSTAQLTENLNNIKQILRNELAETHANSFLYNQLMLIIRILPSLQRALLHADQVSLVKIPLPKT